MKITLIIAFEIAKVIMIVATWVSPFLASYYFKDKSLLWFLILSFFITIGIFDHYKDLIKLILDNAEE